MKKDHSDVIDDFLSRYPSIADLFIEDITFTRQLWKKIIFEKWSKKQKGTWIILGKLLDKDVIPDDEKEEFYKELFKFVGKSFPDESNKIAILEKTDYFQRLKKVLFDKETYEYPNTFFYANENVYSIVKYLNKYGMDKDSVIIINEIIGKMSYGDFVDSIHAYLLKENNWDKFREILENEGVADNSNKIE